MVSGRATLATSARTLQPAQSMADLAERGSLSVGELQPPFQLRPEDPVFGSQIFVPRQQFLVHHPRDVGAGCAPNPSVSSIPHGAASGIIGCCKKRSG
jgi:hypothetical protein